MRAVSTETSGGYIPIHPFPSEIWLNIISRENGLSSDDVANIRLSSKYFSLLLSPPDAILDVYHRKQFDSIFEYLFRENKIPGYLGAITKLHFIIYDTTSRDYQPLGHGLPILLRNSWLRELNINIKRPRTRVKISIPMDFREEKSTNYRCFYQIVKKYINTETFPNLEALALSCPRFQLSDNEEGLSTNLLSKLTSLTLNVPESLISLREALESSSQMWSLQTLEFNCEDRVVLPTPPPCESYSPLKNLKHIKINDGLGLKATYDPMWQGLQNCGIELRTLAVQGRVISISHDLLNYMNSDYGRELRSFIIRSRVVYMDEVIFKPRLPDAIAPELFLFTLRKIRHSLVNLELDFYYPHSERLMIPGNSLLEIEFPLLEKFHLTYDRPKDRVEFQYESAEEEAFEAMSTFVINNPSLKKISFTYSGWTILPERIPHWRSKRELRSGVKFVFKANSHQHVFISGEQNNWVLVEHKEVFTSYH